MNKHLRAFAAGFISTLIFHQGAVFIFYLIGTIPSLPFNMSPTWPLGIPSIISASFFGGLWGILIWHLVKNDSRAKHWIKAFVLGGALLTLVSLLLIFPMKGIPVAAKSWVIGFILNGTWGIGNSLFCKLFKA